ncbi:MAG: L-threonylcarbamoyladenylate synthase [Kiritimatiellaeota bacterium]|nr:L-threonylcarbamoyladenylate synthase [Kiritimatiellota bacterium]
MERLQPQDALQWKAAALRTVEVLVAGGVVVAPTDTVYGLLALWENAPGRERIYVLKRRPRGKPLQMLASGLDTALRAGVLPDDRLRRLDAAFWPGPLTVVAGASDGGSIGVRVPDSDFIREVLRLAGGPLAATSANLSGRPPALAAVNAAADLHGEPDLLVDGGHVLGGGASTVVRLGGEGAAEILRPGPISASRILTVLA